MTTLTEAPHAGEYILSEANGALSRETASVSGGPFDAGTVLGQITVGAATAATIVGTGNATISTIVVVAGAVPGVHTLRAIAATKLWLLGPDGQYLGQATAGTAATLGGLTFTVTAGGTAMVAGDSFAITVAAGSSAYTAHDPDATDGSQVAAAVLYAAVTASTAVDATVTARQAEVNDNYLTWADGISAGEKTAAIAALATHQIIVR